MVASWPTDQPSHLVQLMLCRSFAGAWSKTKKTVTAAQLHLHAEQQWCQTSLTNASSAVVVFAVARGAIPALRGSQTPHPYCSEEPAPVLPHLEVCLAGKRQPQERLIFCTVNAVIISETSYFKGHLPTRRLKASTAPVLRPGFSRSPSYVQADPR